MSEPSEILTAVQKTFISEFDKSEKLTALYKKVDDGTATFKEVEELSGEIGDMLSNAYASNIGEEVEVTSEMAEAVLKPTLKNNYDLVTDACTKTQDNLNQQAGLSMKAVVPGADQNRIQGIIDKAVDDRLIDYGQMMRTLKKNTTNYSMSVADTFIEKNADYQYQSGLRPTIKRTLNGIKPCPFCIARAGSYTYPLKDHEVYRRHANCYCTVEYTPVGSKTSQNIWDKKWRTQEETEKQQRLQTARSIENIEASQKIITPDKQNVTQMKKTIYQNEQKIERLKDEKKRAESKFITASSTEEMKAAQFQTNDIKRRIESIKSENTTIQKSLGTLVDAKERFNDQTIDINSLPHNVRDKKELDAISSYTRNGYLHINDYLRTGNKGVNPKAIQDAKALETAIERNIVEEPFTVKRGTDSNAMNHLFGSTDWSKQVLSLVKLALVSLSC